MINWILPFIKEFGLMFLGRLAFKALFERLVTRWVRSGLYWLADRSTNLLTRGDVDALMKDFSDKKLKAAEQK